jgi:hypothetical protein
MVSRRFVQEKATMPPGARALVTDREISGRFSIFHFPFFIYHRNHAEYPLILPEDIDARNPAYFPFVISQVAAVI